MQIREYKRNDLYAVAELMYKSVHAISSQFYTEEQLRAWAPSVESMQNTLAINSGLVCIEDDTIVGIIEMISPELVDGVGYIKYLYTHPDYQRKGIASRLFHQIEKEGITKLGISEFTVEASSMARPFFEKEGFLVRHENRVKRNGVYLTNYTMIKTIR